MRSTTVSIGRTNQLTRHVRRHVYDWIVDVPIGHRVRDRQVFDNEPEEWRLGPLYW